MPNWWAEATGAASQPKAAPAQMPSVDWWKEATTAPQAPYGGGVQPDQPIMKGREVGMGAQFVGGFASDDAETVRYFAKTLYPDEPVEQSAQRFGMRGKKLYHKGDDGNLYEVVPRRGFRGMAGSVASGAGKAIPAVTGAAAGILTAPLATTGVGAAATLGAAYAGGAGGEFARQKLGDVMMGDASTGDEGTNYLSVAGEGLMSAAGQGAGVGVGAASQRSQARDISRLDPAKTAKSYDLAKRYGVDITPGQATGLKTMQAEEKRLATRVPETADQMQDFLQKQSTDLQDAWYRQLDVIAPSRDAEETGRAIRGAAESVLKDVTKARRAASKPLYQAWTDEGAPVNTASILERADAELGTAARGGATSQTLKKVRGFLTDEDGNAVADPVRLHNARIELSNIIDTRSVDGTSLNNTIVGKLQGIKNDLTKAMDEASVTAGGGAQKAVDPNSLIFREGQQNRLEFVRENFPSGEYSPIVAIRNGQERTILDGHNRAAVAIERGDKVPIVDVSAAEYRRLSGSGFDDMEIAYAALSRAGEDDAASMLARQFPGTKMVQRGTQAEGQLDELRPKGAPGLYKQARSTFSELSEDVDDAFGSALARIAKLNDTSVLSAAREAFNPKTRSPQMIGRLRMTLAKKDPAAWQDLKRLWLQDEISDGLTTAQSGQVINPAGKLLSALESPGLRRSMDAALSDSERTTLGEFKFLMRRISNANLGMGSDTAANLAADKEALTKATPVWASAARKLGTLVNPLSWTQGGDRATEMAAGRNMRSQAKELTNLVTSGDRDAIKAIRELRMLTPRQWRALAASGQLALRAPPVAFKAGRSALSVEEGEQSPE